MKKIALIPILVLWCCPLTTAHFPRWILWNVGQGQWFTHSTTTHCHHLDMGGEKAPWQQIVRECGHKKNILVLSHWDWDHLSLIRQARYRLNNLCLKKKPSGPLPSSRGKQRLVQKLPRCQTSSPWLEITWPIRKTKKLTANDFSRVMVSKSGHVLIPADSPKVQERVWVFQLKQAHRVRLLILGHHGSRTSTSNQLLKRLNHLKQAWVSSRHKRYRHPHPKVRKKLKKHGIPLLSTEDWGNLAFEDLPY